MNQELVNQQVPVVIAGPEGRLAYERYAAYKNWKTFDGRRIPSWDENSDDSVKQAWQFAAQESVSAFGTGAIPNNYDPETGAVIDLNLVLQVKAMRSRLDREMGILGNMIELRSKYGVSAESLDTASMFLETARMWLGKYLGVVGAPYPYPNGNNPASTVIDPPSDISPQTLAPNPYGPPKATQPYAEYDCKNTDTRSWQVDGRS